MLAEILAGAATGVAVALILTPFFVRDQKRIYKLLSKDAIQERDAYLDLKRVYGNAITEQEEAAKVFRNHYLNGDIYSEQDCDSPENSRGN